MRIFTLLIFGLILAFQKYGTMSHMLSNTMNIDVTAAKAFLNRHCHKFANWQNDHPRTILWVLCGPFAFILSIFSMASLPFVLPVGAGHIDHIVLPVVLFPLIWCGLLIAPLMMERPSRTMLIYTCLFIVEVLVIGVNFMIQ